MKNYLTYLVVVLFLFSPRIAQSQFDSDSISIRDLEIPDAPALMLLDKTPSSIDNPNSIKSIIVGVSNAVNSDSDLPLNFGMEFSPMWLIRNRNLSFSTGMSSQIDSVSNIPISNLSYGIRVNIFSAKRKNWKDDFEAELKKVDDRLIELLNRTVEPTRNAGESEQDFAKRIVKWETKKNKDLKENKNSLRDLVQEKPIFNLSIAYARSQVFEDNDYSTRRLGRSAFWTTISSSIPVNDKKTNYFNFYIMNRFISDSGELVNDEYERDSKYDIGGKIEFEAKNLILSYEYVHRNKSNDSTKRHSGIVKYKINDDIAITGSFGRNFGDIDNLISLFGLNWGFQNKTQEKAKTK